MTIKKNLDIEAILDAINKDHLVVFVGAGVSANSNLPNWFSLVKEFASALGIDREIGSDDFLKIPQYYYNQRGKNEYFKKIMDIFDVQLSPNIIHDYILKLKPRHIITTNYDNLIEQAIEEHFMFYDIVKEDIDLPYASNGRMLIKMHGDLTRKNIVLKEDDYLNYSTNFKLIESYVRSIFINNTVLFVGYSLQDYDLKLIMKNLQGILGEHFQKAYLIDSSDSPKLLVEKEYFKNLGVNLIDKFDILSEYSNKEVSELKAAQGKNVVRIIDYILQYKESVRNPLDFCYEKFQSFDSLNKIRVKDLTNILDIGNNYFLEDGGVLKIIPIEDDNFYIDLLDRLNAIKQSYGQQDWETQRKYNYINFTLSKLNLSKISIEDKSFKLEPSCRKESSIIEDVLSNKYFSINLLAKQDYKTINDYKDKIINEMMRAYAKYLVNQFVSAFEILEKISIEAYRKKNFISLYIIEFNKRFLIGKLKRNVGSRTIIFRGDLGESVFIEQINKIINTYENSNLKIEEAFEMLTKQDKDNVRFIHDLLLDQGYILQRHYRIKELAEKVNEDVNTRFSGLNPTSKAVNDMIRDVYEFFDYTHNNFIMVDQYTEVKDYYYYYVKSMLSTYSVKEKSEVQTEADSLFSDFLFHRIPNHCFSYKDIIIITKYLDWRKLERLFEENNIDEIETSCPSIHLSGLFVNLINSYLEVEYFKGLREILKNTLCLFGKIKINKEYLEEIVDNLLKLLNSTDIENEIYLTVLSFLYGQKRFGNLEGELISRLIVSFVNKLLDLKYNGNQGGFELDALNNNNYIQGFINLMDQLEIDDLKIEVNIEKLIDSIQYGTLSNNKRNIVLRLLIPIHSFLIPEQQELVKANIQEILLQNFDTKIYGVACCTAVILPEEVFEQKLFEDLQKTKNEIENSKARSYPDPLKSALGAVASLIRHNKIINRELFSKFIGIDDFYDLVLQEDNFDYQKFNLDWFRYLKEVEVRKILSNPINKEILREKFVKSLVEDEMEAKLKQFYLDYFES